MSLVGPPVDGATESGPVPPGASGVERPPPDVVVVDVDVEVAPAAPVSVTVWVRALEPQAATVVAASSTARAKEARRTVRPGWATEVCSTAAEATGRLTVDLSTRIRAMVTISETGLEGAALEAWRSYLQSHASILRVLDADLASEHGLTTRDYEVLLYLSQAEDRRLPMSALAERTMLTRSGITRLVDGLVASGLIERVSCPNDARVSYAHLTDGGYEKLRQAGCSHVSSIRKMFLEHFSPEEVEVLASLLGRLPGARTGGSCTAEAPAGTADLPPCTVE